MKRSAVFLFVAGLVWACLLVAANSQEDMAFVDRGYFIDPQRPAAVFPHELHNEKAEIYECNECHHVYEDGVKLEDESSEDESCAECHGLEDEGRTPSLIKAFHFNCKGCHLEKKAGPVMCGECHRR
jgi:hypothetical protein